MLNNSHWKLAKNWQNDSCTNKAVRKMESGRKGREVIRLEPVPLGGNSDEKGDYMGGDPPWRVSGLSHTLVRQHWAPTQGRWAPLAGWTASRTNRMAVGSLGSAHEEHTDAFLLLKQSREGRLRMHEWLASFPQPLWHEPQLELSKTWSPACFTVQLHTGVRVTTTQNKLAHETQRQLRHEAVWARWGQPLLMLTQATHQKQSRLMAAGPLHPSPWHIQKASTDPACPAV